MSGGAPASAGPTTDLQPAQGAGDRRKDLKSSAPWEACMSMHIPVGTTALPRVGGWRVVLIDPMVVRLAPLKRAANTVNTVPNDATGSI